MKQLKVLVVYPELIQMGGAELFTVHLIDALIEMGLKDITLLSYNMPNFDNFSGHLAVSEISKIVKVHLVPQNKVTNIIGRSSYLFHSAYLQRYLRTISKNYDVCISAWNEVNFGKGGIQYIHAPLYAPRDLLVKYKVVHQQKWLYKQKYIDGMYRKMLKFYGGISNKALANNLTLVNSKFIKNLYFESYHQNATVLYPGFVVSEKIDNLKGRENNLISLGRIAADKGILEALPIYKQISEHLPDLKLIWFGACDIDSAYYKEILSICKEQSIPIQFKINRSNEEINDYLRRSKYFLHPKYFEHFGIAVLEAINLGCLPIVHRGGGVTEIVPFQELHFDTLEDVTKQLIYLQSNSNLCEQLRYKLEQHKTLFTKKQFNAQVKQQVLKFLEHI